MDNLNKLRLLAGVPVKHTPSAPKTLVEARAVPQRKTELAEKNDENLRARVNYMNAAAQAVSKAIGFLDKIPSTDFMGDVPHFVAELESLLNGDGGEGGMADLAAKYQTEYRSWKRKDNAMKRANEGKPLGEAFEDDDFMDDDFADKSADLDAQAYGASKGTGKTSDRVAAKIDAYAKSAVDGEADADDEESGWDVPEDEFAGDELALGDVEDGDLDPAMDDEFADDEFADDEEFELDDEGMRDDGDMNHPLSGEHDGPDEDEIRDPFDGDLGDEEFEFDVDGETGAPRAEIGDEEFDDGVAGRRWPSDRKRPHVKGRPMESTNFYYDKEQPRPENTAKDVKAGDDKNESPNQLEKLKPSPSDHEAKVKVPNSVKQALRDSAAEARSEAKRLGVSDKDALWFYENLAKAFEELLGHLEAGTLYDIKKAQIFMTSLMGPMLHKIPAEVVNFVAKGGESRSLKDFMKPVDKKYPVTGKMYQGD